MIEDMVLHWRHQRLVVGMQFLRPFEHAQMEIVGEISDREPEHPIGDPVLQLPLRQRHLLQ